MSAAAVLDPRTFEPERLAELVDEIGSRNHVRVVKYEARSKQFGHRYRVRTLDEMSERSQLCGGLHGVVFADSMRMISGLKPIYFDEAVRLLGGDLRSVTKNLRTNAGADFAAAQLSGTSVAVADWIALANNTITPNAADTSSTHPWDVNQNADAAPSGTTGEYTVLGVARKNAVYAHSGGTATYTLSATWTASGTVTSLRLAGLFGGAGKTAQGAGATNILFLENTFTTTSLANLDQLSLTWTVSV